MISEKKHAYDIFHLCSFLRIRAWLFKASLAKRAREEVNSLSLFVEKMKEAFAISDSFNKNIGVFQILTFGVN